MRIIGIDYGSKRIGVAVSDPSGRFALPLSIVPNTPALAVEIEKIAAEQGADEVVLGESKTYGGQPNDILEASLAFKSELEKRGLVVHLEPEFMTSMHAERLQGKHDKIDASAAAIILQSYLDKARTEEDLGE